MIKNKRYEDYESNEKSIPFTKFKIVVPTEEDKQEIMAASEHIHYSSIDTEYVTVNQIAHEYCNVGEYAEKSNIIVSKTIFDKLCQKLN